VKRYVATLVAEFAIEAENIAQARKAAKVIRSLGERAGARSPGPHDKHLTRYNIDLVLERVDVRRASPSGEGAAKGGEG
jgi:hypothetical protein